MRVSSDGAEVFDGGLLVGLEQVVHRRDLQRRDLHAVQHANAVNRLNGAVDDEPRKKRYSTGVGLIGIGHCRHEFGVRQRMPLARAAAGHDPAGARLDDEVDLLTHAVFDELTFSVERHGDRWHDTAQNAAHIGSFCTHGSVLD